MSFEVPTDSRSEYYNSVCRKTELLIKNNILVGIKHFQLRAWLNNFESTREQYLAAHLLDAMIYRSDDMLKSMLRHLLEMELPAALEECGYDTSSSMRNFLDSLSSASDNGSIKFVALDGEFDRVPGKSGAAIIRDLRDSGLVNKIKTVRPENVVTLPDKIKYLVMIDDFVGTGSQFEKFANHYDIESWAKKFKLIYLSYMAYEDGLKSIKDKFPYITLRCGELLSTANNFFAASKIDSNLWGRDSYNSVDDVKKFYDGVLKKKGISDTVKLFDLGLTVVTSMSVPNNTLKAYWSDKGQWSPIRSR
ncbi:hypothetical protein H8K32_09980 [Undibacterium jejuense]|uniref:PRTase-CE domain-containing protein n=1 Tax=Undibacterium jejuense TaxID=1344949 RepID=A0A923HE85_9BURK|nr:hypothetical protein [Undibacterium jejuense]MBC3862426.1 hypothetical protein [Undibacterium jejuense]